MSLEFTAVMPKADLSLNHGALFLPEIYSHPFTLQEMSNTIALDGNVPPASSVNAIFCSVDNNKESLKVGCQTKNDRV